MSDHPDVIKRFEMEAGRNRSILMGVEDPDDLVLTRVPGQAASWSPEGGGSGAARVLGPFPFAHDTPNLNEGVEFYTPTVNDVLLDGWVEVIEAFNGTTPLCDIGSFVGVSFGWFGNADGPLDLTLADAAAAGDGFTYQGFSDTAIPSGLAIISGGTYLAGRFAPGRFDGANPLKVVASRNGTAGGVATGATQGRGAVYLVIATPSLT